MKSPSHLENRLARVVALQTELLASDFAPDTVLRIAAEGAQQLTGAAGAGVLLLTPGALQMRAATGRLASLAGTSLPMDGSFSGRALREGHAMLCQDVKADPQAASTIAHRMGVGALLAVPLSTSEGPLGVLKVCADEPQAFAAGDLELLELISGMLATAISRAREAEERRALEAARARDLAALRETEALVRALFEASPLLMGVVDLLDDDVLFRLVNPPLAASYGLPPEKMVNTRAIELGASPEVIQMLRSVACEAIEGGTTRHLEYQRGPAGTPQFISANLTPLPPAPNGTPRVCFVSQDVTERVLLQRQLDVTDQMAAVGRLAAGVAHELNNPLAFLLSNLRFAQEELAETGAELSKERLTDVRSALRDAVEGGERVSGVVANLTAFTRSSDQWSSEVDLVRVCEQAMLLAQHALRSDVELVRALEPLPPVKGNEARLGHVVLNLLVNAARAFPPDWTGPRQVTVRTGRLPGDEVFLDVVDSGEGIPPDRLARIFEPFSIPRPADPGSGFGLSLCQNIVMQHGGRLEAQNLSAGGASFRIVLPAKCPEA
jgi:PAS domain S-box-containing protein